MMGFPIQIDQVTIQFTDLVNTTAGSASVWVVGLIMARMLFRAVTDQ